MAAAMQDVIAARGAGGNWARVHFKKSRPERLMVGYVVRRGGRPCQMGGHFRALRRTKIILYEITFISRHTST